MACDWRKICDLFLKSSEEAHVKCHNFLFDLIDLVMYTT